MPRCMNLSHEMGGCSFIFAVSIISNTKYSEDIGREKVVDGAQEKQKLMRKEKSEKKILKTN